MAVEVRRSARFHVVGDLPAVHALDETELAAPVDNALAVELERRVLVAHDVLRNDLAEVVVRG
eukprot:3688785-Heterocapsa_arctica.AAC.1